MQPEPQGHEGSAALARGPGGVASAWPGGPPLGVLAEGALSRVRGWCLREVDARRPALWLPVAAMLGIAAYFAAEVEPAPWAAPAGFVLALAVALLRRGRPVVPLALLAAAGFGGFAAAGLRTALMAAPVLQGPLSAPVQGFVESLDPRIGNTRILVRVTAVGGLPRQAMPQRVRVTLQATTTVQPGDHVAADMRLLPPPEASRPGGYSFAREAFFQGIGAIGTVSGALALAPPPGPIPWDVAIGSAIDRARNALTRRIVDVIGGAGGAVAASLVTGKRGQIPEDVNEVLRSAGIYHVVSISGLHMVIAAGMAFWLVRAVLALVPALALRWPIRKIAAVAAMAAGAAYNLFAGAEIATQRSLVMTLALFGAMLVDRAALSMRNLAIAALIIMAIEPESVTGPSFQMSFAAVGALIALYERKGEPEAAGAEGRGGWSLLRGDPAIPLAAVAWPWRIARWCLLAAGGAVLTTLAAEAATAPFSLYHFQRISPYGVIGNALTLPLVSFVVMPMALLGAVLFPFGLDAPAWLAMGLGIEGMLRLSALVAGWSGSTAVLPAFGGGALALMVGGLLWTLLWITPLRWIGLLPAGLGVALAVAEPRADIVVAPDGASAAVRLADGRLGLLGRGPGAFVLEQWLRADGDPRRAQDLLQPPAPDPGGRPAPRCDPSGCVTRLPDGTAVALVRTLDAFEEDCRRASVIVTPLAAPAWCRPVLLLDRSRLARTGAVAVVWRPEGLAVTTARTLRTDRPWRPRPPEETREAQGEGDDRP